MTVVPASAEVLSSGIECSISAQRPLAIRQMRVLRWDGRNDSQCRESIYSETPLTPLMQRAGFLCLLVLSFMLSSSGNAAGNASGFTAGPAHPCVPHFGSGNLDPKDHCPCLAPNNWATTCCCPTYRPLRRSSLNRRSVYQAPSVSGRPSQVLSAAGSSPLRLEIAP